MREILFRGAQKVVGSKSLYWHEGSLVIEKDDYTGYLEYYIQNGSGSFLVIPETVGQYTGLTDKNGTKIFEGDIVKEKDCVHNGEIQIYGRKWAIYFKDGVFFGYRKGYKDCVSTIFLHNIRGIERIGNIHDNPELLKEAEQE